MIRRVGMAASLCGVLTALTACASIFGGGAGGWLGGGLGGGAIVACNLNTGKKLEPKVIAAAYRASDANTAEIYLSDLPMDRLKDGADDLKGLSGTIVHIHLFLVPSAGDTPIDPTACNVSIRQLVLASNGSEPVAGLYVGGGFVYPSRDPGAETLGGSIFDSSLRLAAATGGGEGRGAFVDLLTPMRISGSFTAPQDEDAAVAIQAKFEKLAAGLVAQPRNEAAGVESGADATGERLPHAR